MRAPVRSALIAAMTASISVTSSGISGAAIIWSNPSVHYDNGNYPSVAQGPNNWADAHDGALYDLWYHVNGQSGYKYDHGYLPTIATDTWGNFIDIHQASSVPSAIWSKIGFDNGSGAQYMVNSATQIDFGYSPVIAVHGHNCVPGTPGSAPQSAFADIVQVHQADASGPTPLWMNFATATNIDCNNGGSTPRWGGVQWLSGQQYATGFYPSIAIDSFIPPLPGGCVIEVHQDGPGFGTVRWQSGSISFVGTSWSYTQMASGTFPSSQHASVCIYDEVEADIGVMVMELNDGTLYSVDAPIGFDQGTNSACVWNVQKFNIQQYDRGAYPRVSCQSGAVNGMGGGAKGVEVHQASSSTSAVALWSRTFTAP
jgi:hypothetical protein